MNCKKGYGLVFVTMLLAACGMGDLTEGVAPEALPRSAASASADRAGTTPRMPAAEVAASADDLESRLSKNMAYADLRVIALENGWKPIVDPQCKSNVVGDNHTELCAANPGLISCQICERLPELGSCSGDGYCGMAFSKDGRTLGITTYGMIEDWNVRGDQSRLNVLGWKTSR